MHAIGDFLNVFPQRLIEPNLESIDYAYSEFSTILGVLYQL